MAFGTLAPGDEPIPSFAPAYPTTTIEYSNLSAVFVNYRTALSNVRPLVPNVLELEEEPLIGIAFISYPASTLGPYQEFIVSVQVKYQGESISYPISMILDNESAIYLGREMYGYPKTFGTVQLEHTVGSSAVNGAVSNAKGDKIAQVDFMADRILEGSSDQSNNKVLGLRVIPSPVANTTAQKELIPSSMTIKGGETCSGKASFSFCTQLETFPLYKLAVLRYESAVFLKEASAIINPAQTTYLI